MKHKKWLALAVALLAVFLIFAAAAPEGMRGGPASDGAVPPPEAAATRIIDGDTLEAGGRSVRLLGVDAPERGRCFYEEARQELARLVLGQALRLEGDPLNDDADEYGRLLRYVYLPDGTLVNARLIAGGFARHLSWFPIEENERFAELEDATRENQLGLWAACQR
jgi:micrococcal nuclease